MATTNAPSPKPQAIFLSHNSADKAYAGHLAAALQLAGARVWFDAWEIRPGDSIPNAINDGLVEFDTFALLWSAGAAASRWVTTEMNGALSRWMMDRSCRLVPVILDDTTLPPLIHHLRYVDARKDRQCMQVAKELLGIKSDKHLLMAVQAVIDEAGLHFREFYGAGVYVCCPKCGADLKELEVWQSTDYDHDRLYAGARCRQCGWEDGGEV